MAKRIEEFSNDDIAMMVALIANKQWNRGSPRANAIIMRCKAIKAQYQADPESVGIKGKCPKNKPI